MKEKLTLFHLHRNIFVSSCFECDCYCHDHAESEALYRSHGSGRLSTIVVFLSNRYPPALGFVPLEVLAPYHGLPNLILLHFPREVFSANSILIM
jgi:hypothetical protein